METSAEEICLWDEKAARKTSKPEWRPKTNIRRCTVGLADNQPRCRDFHHAKGFCVRHYREFIRKPNRKKCSYSGCQSSASHYGILPSDGSLRLLCSKHVYRSKKGLDMAAPDYFRTSDCCRSSKCDTPLDRGSSHGFCRAHAYRFRKGLSTETGIKSPSLDIDITKFRWRGEWRLCGIEGCPDYHYARGVCRKHYDRQKSAKRSCLDCGESIRNSSPRRVRCVSCSTDRRKKLQHKHQAAFKLRQNSSTGRARRDPNR